LPVKIDGVEKQQRVILEKISAMDRHVASLNASIEDIVNQVENSNRFTANQLYTQNLKLSHNRNGIAGGISSGDPG